MSPPTVLAAGATPADLQQAAAHNTTAWLSRCVRADGGEVVATDAATWVCGSTEAAILFPRVADEVCAPQLDQLIAFYLERRPSMLVGCWSLDPPQPHDLGVRLLARGFQPGWQPHWMALDLAQLRTADGPDGLRIAVADDEGIWDQWDHPYLAPNEGSSWRQKAHITHAAAQAEPRQVWHFVAWLDGRPVGHATINVTIGALGVAGIYDVGVLPELRRRGIGAAVTVAACRFALELGYKWAVLNATPLGQPVYERVGFVSVGWGLTWWLNVDRLAGNPPTRLQIELAEAVGRGDPAALTALAGVSSELLNTPLTNEMTLLALAAELQQPATARWLLEHGAALDVLSAWDLGLKTQLRQALAAQPELVDRLDTSGKTPLHEAVWRDDAELVRLLLEHGADPTTRDKEFESTPLGWAQHLGRTELLPLLEPDAKL